MPKSKFVHAEETTTTFAENIGDAHTEVRYACQNCPESALSEIKIGMGLVI